MKRLHPVSFALLFGFAARLGLIFAWPSAFSNDGYQRWAGREHLLVQDWLPATQAIIATVALLGGNIVAARVAMALVGALAGAAATIVAMQLGKRLGDEGGATRAGWLMVVASLYGPTIEWTTVLYQEGTFLLVLFSAIALALSGRTRLADLVIGLMGLVRYEGWPCVALYVLWRRDRRALVALYGIAIWMVIRFVLHMEPYRSSPVNFADWEGLTDRFRFKAWMWDVWRFWTRAWATGGSFWLILALVGFVRLRRESTAWLVTGMFMVQAAATSAWLAGLEVSTSRMLIIPVALGSPLAAVAAAWIWPKLRRPTLYFIASAALVIFSAMEINDAGMRMKHEQRRMVAERKVIEEMDKCGGCTWWIEPRKKLGTRERHDGCEAIQGMSGYMHGREFWCAPWVPSIEAASLYATCSGTVRWDGERYVVERHLPGGSGAPPLPIDGAVQAGPADE